MITVQCPCGKRLRAGDDLAGRVAKCPGCGAMLDVPMPDDEPAELELERDSPEDPPAIDINTDTPMVGAASLAPVSTSPSPVGTPANWTLFRHKWMPLWPWYYSMLAGMSVLSFFIGLGSSFGPGTFDGERSALTPLRGLLSIAIGWSFVGTLTFPFLLNVLIDIGVSLRTIANRLPGYPDAPGQAAKK
jgi:hypothetical protein